MQIKIVKINCEHGFYCSKLDLYLIGSFNITILNDLLINNEFQFYQSFDKLKFSRNLLQTILGGKISATKPSEWSKDQIHSNRVRWLNKYLFHPQLLFWTVKNSHRSNRFIGHGNKRRKDNTVPNYCLKLLVDF